MASVSSISNLISQKIAIINDFDDTYPSNPNDIISGGFSEYGKSGYDIFTEIARDSKVSGVEKIIRRTLFSADWQIQYENDENKKDEIIDFITDNFNSLENDEFVNVLNNLMDARIYGFKVAEKVFKYENNKMMLKYIKCFDSEIFDFKTDKYKNLTGVVLQSAQTKYEIIDIDTFRQKFIHFVYPYISDNNYYGTSAYYPIYETWRRKQRLNLIAPIAYELRLIPPIKNIYDQSAPDTVRKSIDDTLNNVKNSSRISIPAQRDMKNGLAPLFDVQFLEGGQINFQAIIKQIDEYDKDISRTLGLPDDIGYTTTENGSNAKAKTQIRVFYDLIIQDQKRLENTVNKQIIKQLIDINFGEQKVYPKFKLIRQDFESMAMKIALIKELKSSNIPVTDDYVQKFLDVPLEEKSETEIEVKEKPIEKPIEMPKPEQKPEQKTEIEIEKKEVDSFQYKGGIFAPNIKLVRNNIINRIDYQKVDDFYENISTGYSVRFIRELNNARFNFLKQGQKDFAELEFPNKEKSNISKYLYALCVRSYLDGKEKSKLELQRKSNKFSSERQFVADWLLEKNVYKRDELMNIQDVLQEYLDKGVTLTKSERRELLNIKTFASIWSKKLTNDITDKINLMLTTINPDLMNASQIAGTINDIFAKYTPLIEKNNVEKFIPVSELNLPYLNTVIRTNVSAYFNRGRYAVQTSPEVADIVTALRYSAILDTRTTWFCQEHHNETLKIDDPQVSIIYPPNHYGCRSLFSPVFYDDDYEIDWNSKSMNTKQAQEAYSSPAQNFGGRGVVDIPTSIKDIEKGVE